ncbi:RNA-directed DNA polymerase, eukaryota [Tanacetum coccineum]|uniref:RNA-directed DNA polymerase, eukaryota n=1 Tax=Tanacetum coccineum TaxID=301880 RepID=A0ABQ5CCC2_9ASTR
MSRQSCSGNLVSLLQGMDNQLSHTTQGLPLTQQALSHSQHEKLVDELLVRSMRLLDICGSIRDVVSQVKGHVHDIQSTQRDASFPKKLKKTVKKSVEKLKQVEGFEPPQEDDAHVLGSIRTHQAPERLCLNVKVEEHSLGDLNEPANYKGELLDPESNKWLDAMNAEMQSMKDNQVWRLVGLMNQWTPISDVAAILTSIQICKCGMGEKGMRPAMAASTTTCCPAKENSKEDSDNLSKPPVFEFRVTDKVMQQTSEGEKMKSQGNEIASESVSGKEFNQRENIDRETCRNTNFRDWSSPISVIRAREIIGWNLEFIDEDSENDSHSEVESDFTLGSKDLGSEDKAENGLYDELKQEVKEKERGNLDDPFGLYDLLKKGNQHQENSKEDSDNLSKPPGFEFRVTDKVMQQTKKHVETNVETGGNSGYRKEGFGDSRSFVEGLVPSGYKPKMESSLLEKLNDFVEIGQAVGYSMEGCLRNIEELIIEHGVVKVDDIDEVLVKSLWGNSTFDYAFSSSVGYSIGVVCVWDKSMFIKVNVSVSDYFFLIEGEWKCPVSKTLMIAIYAPQALSKKRMLWGYLHDVIFRWSREIIVMGDFNELRMALERYGSIFHKPGADAFNYFITSSGLNDIPLGGYTFTWVHKDADKMSKLDRFLVSDGVLATFPSFTGVILDKLSSIYLKKKLQLLKKKLRAWGKDARKGLEKKQFEIQSEICELDKRIDSGCLSALFTNSRASLHKSLLDLDKIRDMRHQRSIRGVLVNGEWIENPDRAKREFHDHFASRFSNSHATCLFFEGSFPRSLSNEQAASLEVVVTDQEIKNAGRICVKAIKEIFASGKFSIGCNSSFISLIPKISDAKFVKDFRPISLIGCQYKIVGKILANRLSVVIDDLVSLEQSAFIKGRKILDGPMILNEVLSWCNNKKNMIFKVDFEKAFDSVRLDFLDDIIHKFGFGSRWCGWIAGCLKSSTALVLVNGSPTKEFRFQNGLRQGDPLSPFLFLLVMEFLHIFFYNALQQGFFKGVGIGRNVGSRVSLRFQIGRLGLFARVRLLKMLDIEELFLSQAQR